MELTGFSAPDPYVMQSNSPLSNESYDYSGLTQVSPVFVGGESTCVIIGFGDSTISNTVNATYSPTNGSKVQSLSIGNGGVYLASDPQLGAPLTASSGSLLFRLGDKLISNGTYARVIFCLIGLNSAKIADWATGGVLNYRIPIAAKRLAAVGLTPNFVLCQIGANDTVAGTSQAAYAASLQSAIDSFRAAGVSGPFLTALSTYTSGSTSSAIRAAQAGVTNTGASVYDGPDLDTITTDRHDGTHFDATGRNSAADLWITKMGLVP